MYFEPKQHQFKIDRNKSIYKDNLLTGLHIYSPCPEAKCPSYVGQELQHLTLNKHNLQITLLHSLRVVVEVGG